MLLTDAARESILVHKKISKQGVLSDGTAEREKPNPDT